MKNLLRGLAVGFLAIVSLSCSEDDTLNVGYETSFTIQPSTDLFVNRDGSVNVLVKGAFKDTNPNSVVIERGFVYGLTPNPKIESGNTTEAKGVIENIVVGDLRNLEKEKTYFVRGYFKKVSGNHFYGEELKVVTGANVKDTRSITLEIVAKPFFVSQTEITPEIKVIKIEKESPVEIGFEYSTTEDFSDSKKVVISGVQGNFMEKEYQEVISGLKASTTYYFKPYAKYADGTITNGGTSKTVITTR